MNKPKPSNITRQLILGLCALISIFLLFGVCALYNIHRVSDLSRTIYNHPLVVSNAALKANVSLTKMHRSMKDVVLFHSSSRIQQSIEEVNKEEEQVYQQLNLIKNNILGEEGKALEGEARKLFDAWQPIRNEVIGLVHNDQRENAAGITIGNGAEHVAFLETKMLGLTNYARNRASEFHLETEKVRSKLTVILIFFLVLGIFLSLLVAFFTLKLTSSAEKDLQKSEERYRSLIENQTDLVCRITPDGTFAFVNDMYCQFFNKSKKELIGSKWHLIPVDDDIEIIEEKLSTLSPVNPTVTIENRVLSGKGEIHWVQFIDHGFFDQQGNLLEIQSVGRDITEHKQAQEALRETEEKLHLIIDTSPVGICTVDPLGNFVTTNLAYERMVGYSKEELRGLSFFDVTHPDNRPKNKKLFQDMFSLKTTNFFMEKKYIRKDGTMIEVALHATGIMDAEGNVRFGTAFVEDITDRKQSEEMLRTSEEEYKSTLNNLLIGVVVHAYDTSILFSNPEATNILGLTYEQMSGKKVIDPSWNFVHEDSTILKVEEYPVGKVFSTKKPLYDYVIGIIRPDRDYITWVIVNAIPMFSSENELDKIIVNFVDITALKQSEEKLARFNVDLKAKNEELEQVVYVASHDLRSPLVNIDGYGKELEYSIKDLRNTLSDKSLDTVLDELTPILDADIPEALRFIRTSTAKMDTLLAGLLRLSRSGRAALKIESLDMNQIISKVIASTEFQIKGNGVDVIADDLPPCQGDASQMDQVLSNLLDNTLKCLKVNRPGMVRISGKVVDDQSVYCVEDNGIGIDVSHIDKIFEIFHQLDPAQNKGEGLGLTIVKRILTRLEGSIRVESTIGLGSRFYISMPKGNV